MNATNDLPARLLEHAAIHDAATSPYDDEQAQWARDLREAAAELERLQWRDISTAPPGPEKFNAWVVTHCGTAWFEKECYIDKFGDIRDFHSNLVNEFGRRATHWMPVIPGPNRSEP